VLAVGLVIIKLKLILHGRTEVVLRKKEIVPGGELWV
jgi:hypothetical protein